MSEDVKFWLGLMFAPVAGLGVWLMNLARTQSIQESRIARMESDLHEMRKEQSSMLEKVLARLDETRDKLEEGRVVMTQLTEQVKTLFEERKKDR